jgi:hypothetical protein
MIWNEVRQSPKSKADASFVLYSIVEPRGFPRPRTSSATFLPAAYHPQMLLCTRAREPFPGKGEVQMSTLVSILLSLAVEPEISKPK